MRSLITLSREILPSDTTNLALELAASCAALNYESVLVLLGNAVAELEAQKFNAITPKMRGFWQALELYEVNVAICCDDWNARFPRHTKPELGSLISKATIKHLIQYNDLQFNF